MDEIIFQIVKKNVDLWNPENLLPYAPENEYDIESGQIVKKIKTNHSVEELAEIAAQVFSESFGENYDMKRCKRVAEAIYKDLKEESG